MTYPVPVTEPVELAPETFLVTNMVQLGPGQFLSVNSMLIRGEEPVIVDTGAPMHRELWLDQVFNLVDPKDVRWVFLSHDDGDHIGALHDVLDLCPNATLVANFFTTERLRLEQPLPLPRMIWREPGEYFDAGDRRLRLVLPPIFDGPTTRGLLDERTGVMWAVDSFAALVPEVVHHAQDVPSDLYNESFAMLNSLISPWHQWLDPIRYGHHIDSVEAHRPAVVATAHGPVLTGPAIHDAFDQVRDMAGQPVTDRPRQSVLEELLADLKQPERQP
ncbi:MBL fold metallo-hydrolase [Acrocarpospora catenulata]|uniref:MBL fold metallo-hydrolase n=1 Tax=Acrocarpospora catenulata TaxID=2836182 RepID=UPI001BD9B278|nr:MBL fold metallo-hydrolase [Acrocarpospora catenulata]